MRWPLVWRSTMEREAREQLAIFDREMGKARADLEAARAYRTNEVAAAEYRAAKAKAEAMQFMDAHLAEQERSLAAGESAATADAARIRAEVRAEEWEAIAKELIQGGSGRPTVERPAAPKSPIAERIRAEAAGDPKLAAHFWAYVRELRKQKKSDDEIAGMIGWTSDDPIEAVTV